ncbi:nuclear protein [Macropodid alphaherpesvirus 2]|uniref:Nuclear protein n=1 Tax=Macropodid alphaherpesvirus 2 TaxID=83440 RepID=A0AAE7SYE5_9ALPH|nr:nuclear protein [Macropodid alphaherpesvirus 2]QOD40242.1 nuclear protein [Macropodid alphaherpesvirus 2]WGO49740.1 nuclear protein [Macropodid alphaherpesvirus 2]
MGVISRRRILRAGVRSHTRFYRLFAEEVRKYNRTKTVGRLFKVITGSVKTFSPDLPTHVRIIYEVDLKGRRPDCVCFCEFGTHAQAIGACFIIELKTCKFISRKESASKREQKLTGLSQLQDSLGLINALIPPGTNPLYLCPILVFVSQKTLKVFKVIRLPVRTTQGNIGGLAHTLQNLATYTVPSKPTPRKKHKQHNPSCKPTRSRSSQQTPACVPVLAPPPPPTPSGGLLQAISTLFGQT